MKKSMASVSQLLNLDNGTRHIADAPQSRLATPILGSDELQEQHKRATERLGVLFGKQRIELESYVHSVAGTNELTYQ